MILEVAILHVKPEDISKFEAVFPKAEAIVSSIPGYISNELQRCVEIWANFRRVYCEPIRITGGDREGPYVDVIVCTDQARPPVNEPIER